MKEFIYIDAVDGDDNNPGTVDLPKKTFRGVMNMNRQFDISQAKEGVAVQTRAGLPARIISWDLKGECPLGVAVTLPAGNEGLYSVRERMISG